MGNYLTKCPCIGTSTQREKLEEFFQHITSKAPVDFTNREIKDVQNAVDTMLERLKKRVNSRGIFNIGRIVPTGSAAEQTSLWNWKVNDRNHYLELDFLAVLKNTIKQYEKQIPTNDCQGCISIVNQPLELERVRQYHNKDEFSAENLKDKDLINALFLNEINRCLTSSCDCLSIKCDKDRFGLYKISFRPSSVEHNHGCGECTVDMPTGTLHVNTKININQNSRGPNDCSLIFQWISRANSLSAPDKLLLQKPQPISSLSIYVDFLPALESLKPTSPGPGDEHDFFIVPKSCNVCYDEKPYRSFRDRWRKSWCMAEIQAITLTMSDKHRRCYQIMKYLPDKYLPNYHIKTVALRHHTTCSDTTDDCVDCVMEMFLDLVHAYKTQKLLLYQSNLNIIIELNLNKLYDCEWYITKLCSVSVTDSWKNFIRKIENTIDY